MGTLHVGKNGNIWHYCPGCDQLHRYAVNGSERFKNGCAWDFNGNMEKPSFTPSMLLSWNEGEEHKPQVCHYYLTEGNLIYLSDCTHAYKGKSVPLPPIPDKYTLEGY